MDKNQFTGMVLMAVVIFLFLWWMKPSQKDIEAQRAAQEQAQQALQQSQQTAAKDLISPEAGTALAQIVRQHGTEDTQMPGIYRYSNPSVDLRVDARDSSLALSGNVYAGKDTIDVRRVVANDLLDYSPEQAARAYAAVSQVVNTFGKYKSFAPFFYGKEERTTLENDQVRVTFNNHGGIVEEVTLKNYKTETTDPATDVTLFTAQTGGYGFGFVTSDQRIYTDSLYFKTAEVTDSSLVMSLPLGHGMEWNIRYTLVPEYYVVKMEVEQKGMDAVIPPSCTTVAFDWRQKMARNEKGKVFEERNSALTYKMIDEKPSELSSAKDETEKLTGRIKWVAFKNQFFSSVVIPSNSFSNAEVTSVVLKNNPGFVKNMRMQGLLPYSTQDGTALAFDFYFGPNDYPLLNKVDKVLKGEGQDLDLNRLVSLGWTLFRWINQLIVIPVFTFLSHYTHNYGIIILLLTIFIKIILFPFTYKSYKSQAKMRLLSPEIKEINEKYPGQENAMKRQQETMALYSRAGASPFSGCLPLLLQMPVLIAMFAFFPNAIELRGQSFLWAKDLSAPDTIFTLPFTIPWYGNQVSLFCLLMTVVNVIYIKLSMSSQPSQSSMPGMKVMMYLMPLMYLFFFNDYASGLSYYYFLSLLITIGQTYAFRFFVDEKAMRQQMLENAKNPKKRKKSGFMARLEEAQRRQEAMLREQQRKQGKKR